MAATIITPLLPDDGFVVGQRTSGQTSGDRGLPEMDFDILNQIQSEKRLQLGTLQQSAQSQTDDLSTILQGVNVSVRETKRRKRDSDLMFTQQADELAVKSERIRQQAMEAAADPFNEIKALFGSTKSMAEWAAMHNSIQNEMAAVKRRFTAGAAVYNFSLDEAATDIQVAQQKLGMTEGNIASIARSSQAVLAQIATQSAMFTQQLDTIHKREDLQAELDDPNGEIPKDLVRKRLERIDLAKAKLLEARASAGKSQLDLAAKLFKVVTEFPELINKVLLEKSVRTGQSVFIPILGVHLTSQMARSIQIQQADRAQLDAKLVSDLTVNTLEGQQAFTQVVAMIQRAAEPGIDVLGRDDDGNVLNFDSSALPEDMRRDAALMFDIRDQSLQLQEALATSGKIVGASRDEARLVQNELNRRASALRDKIAETAKFDAQSRVGGKQAKVSAGNFAVLGLVKSDPGAQQLLAEGSAGVITGNSGIISTAHGPAWGAGQVIFGTEYKTQWQSMVDAGSELFTGDDGEMDSQKLVAAMLAGNIQGTNAGVLAAQRALGQVNADGDNIIQVAILSDAYELIMNRVVRELEDRHAAEPETIKILQSMRLGVVALDPTITTQKDKDKNTLDPMNVLIATLTIKEDALIKAGLLPEDSSLVHEYKSLLLGDESSFGSPTTRTSVYNLPEIRAIMKPRTQEGGALHWLLFRNQFAATVQTGLKNITRSIPVDGLDRSLELNQSIRITRTADFASFAEEDKSKIIERIIELEKKEGPNSLTAIMNLLMDSQE